MVVGDKMVVLEVVLVAMVVVDVVIVVAESGKAEFLFIWK